MFADINWFMVVGEILFVVVAVLLIRSYLPKKRDADNRTRLQKLAEIIVVIGICGGFVTKETNWLWLFVVVAVIGFGMFLYLSGGFGGQAEAQSGSVTGCSDQVTEPCEEEEEDGGEEEQNQPAESQGEDLGGSRQ